MQTNVNTKSKYGIEGKKSTFHDDVKSGEKSFDIWNQYGVVRVAWAGVPPSTVYAMRGDGKAHAGLHQFPHVTHSLLHPPIRNALY